jgi:5-methylcytosine-specific restriction protein A
MGGGEMRDELLAWMQTYPEDPTWRDGSFAGSPAATVVTKAVPDAIRQTGLANQYVVQGSAGKGDWTHTPWVALLDPAETSSVEEGVYVVYLLSKGCERLYLTLNQGCTTLKNESSIPNARVELSRRAETIRSRLTPDRLRLIDIDLGTAVWRADLYERGTILGAVYNRSELPDELELRRDLEEALRLYRLALDKGGWAAEDQLASEAASELGEVSLAQAKLYRRHRQIERNPSHSRLVKRLQGPVCRGCDRNPAETYGPIAEGLLDAHHLRPLSTLAENETVTFDPRTDFAVLCPNCHRLIHRLEDAGDLEALRALVKRRS